MERLVYWKFSESSVTDAENKLLKSENAKKKVRTIFRNYLFGRVFTDFWIFKSCSWVTMLDYISPLRTRISSKLPDSCFSDIVDLVLKKSHRKILKNVGRKIFSKMFEKKLRIFLKNFFDQNFSIFFDEIFLKPHLLIEEDPEKQFPSKLEPCKPFETTQ